MRRDLRVGFKKRAVVQNRMPNFRFILTVAATESAIGLAILTTFYRIKNSINVEPIINKINKL